MATVALSVAGNILSKPWAKWVIGGAVVGAVGLTSYGYYSCAQKFKSYNPVLVGVCVLEEMGKLWWDAYKYFWKTVGGALKKVLGPIWDKIEMFFSELGHKIRNFFAGIANKIKEFFQMIGRSIEGFFLHIWQKIERFFENIGHNIEKWFSNLGNKIAHFFSKAVKDAIDKINPASGIKKGASKVKKWFKKTF